MSREQTCRTCGAVFELQPAKPGYIDECLQCVRERLHLNPPAIPIIEPQCEYCGEPVNKEGYVHGACFGRPSVRYVDPETVIATERLIRLLREYHLVAK